MKETTLRLDEINLRALAKALLRNLWVIVLICISIILCYNAFAKQSYQPMYTAKATLMVSAKDSTSAYNSLTTTQSMATVFVEVFQSNILQEKVAQQMPEQTFFGTINTTTIPETNLLLVSVTSHSPKISFQELRLVLENYESISDYLFANAQLEVIKAPVIPTVPSNPQNLSDNYPILIIFGALLGVVLVAVLQIMRKTVQTPESARRNVDARLLRVIHHEVKYKTLQSKIAHKNTALLMNGPLISKKFIEDNLSLCSTVEYHMRKRGQKVMMITSAGENEGKSTVAANLALALAEKNKKVLLLDCDFRKPSLHKIFEQTVSAEDAFSSYLLQEEGDVSAHLVELSKHRITVGLSRAEHKSVAHLLYGGQLENFLKKARRRYDYILLDTPPMLAAADAEAIAGIVDTAIVAVHADFMPINVINEWLDKLRKSVPDVCGIVLNNY